MGKTYLGVDIGYDNLKLALVKDGAVKKCISVPMPKNLIHQGRIVSEESLGELISGAMKENGIRARSAAYVIPSESVFVKNATMPQMNIKQLLYNLPYEFHDYISDELQNYLFDYAMISTPKELAAAAKSEEGTPSMEVLGIGVPKSVIEEARSFLRKAGLKLEKAAPEVCCFASLIRANDRKAPAGEREYCIIDLGFSSIRMYIYRGDRHVVTRELEIGLSSLDDVLAEAFGVDTHLAHTYLLTNYENCQRGDACQGAFYNISVELMRALNFYRFSNPESQLNDVWLCGGGAAIQPLREAILDALDMDIHDAEELIPGSHFEGSNSFVQAVGVTLD